MREQRETTVAELVRRLEGEDGPQRLAAAQELFARGARIVPELQALGAKPMATLTPPRRDVVYTLLTALPKNADRDVFGISFEPGVTAERAAAIGARHGFVISPDSRFTPGARPTCYVVPVAPAMVEIAMRALLEEEAEVEFVNLNVREK